MTTDLLATPISAEDFAPFGQLMQIGQDDETMSSKLIREGTVQFTRSARPLPSDTGAEWSLDFFSTDLSSAPLRMTLAEQHPHSAQVFVPMGTTKWLIIVWPGTDTAAPTGKPRAFTAGPQDAISYAPGIWHHGIVALDGTGNFASMMGRMPGGGDTVFADLPAPLNANWAP